MNNVYGTPGVKTARSTGDFPSIIKNPEYIDGGILIDATYTRDGGNTGDTDVIRPGNILRKLTSGLYAPWLLGVVATDYTTGTTLTVSVATAINIEKTIGSSGTFYVVGHDGTGTGLVDVDAEAVTFSAVNTSTGAITVTALTGDFDAGSAIVATQPMVLGGTGGVASPNLAFAIVDKPDGVKVTDPDDADMDVMLAEAAIGGHVDASQIINWPTLAYVPEVIAANLRAATRLMLDNLYE